MIALLLLTGCAEAASSPVALINAQHGVNPCFDIPIPSYDRAKQACVADEIAAAPAGAAWPDFVRDYGAMRAALRACRSVKP